MQLETQLRLLLAFMELLTESKHYEISGKDATSVLIWNDYHLKIIIEQEEGQVERTVDKKKVFVNEVIRHKKITINDYKNQKEVYAYVTKDDIDPNFDTVLSEVLKRISWDFSFIGV